MRTRSIRPLILLLLRARRELFPFGSAGAFSGFPARQAGAAS